MLQQSPPPPFHSCMIPANRLVALSGGGPIIHVYPLEDCALSVALFDTRHSLLKASNPGRGRPRPPATAAP